MVWPVARPTKTGFSIEIEHEDGSVEKIMGRFYLMDRHPITKKQISLGPCGATTWNQARKAAILKEAEKIKGTLQMRGTGPTLKQACDVFIGTLEENDKRQGTIVMVKRFLGILIEYLGPDHDLLKITESKLLDFRSWLKKREFKRGKQIRTHSINGRRMVLDHVRWLFAFCERRYKFLSPAKHILEGLLKEEVWRALTDAEVSHLYHVNFQGLSDGLEGMGDRYHWQPRIELWTIIMVALHTGMRQGEIVNADASKYHDGEYFLGKNTKTRTRRVVGITDPIRPIFERIKSGPIFPGWSPERLRRIWCKLVKRADIGRIRFHDLRHTYASKAIRTMNLKEVGYLLGHKSQQSTDIYTHLEHNDVRAKAALVRYEVPAIYGPAIVASIVADCGNNQANVGNDGQHGGGSEIVAARR